MSANDKQGTCPYCGRRHSSGSDDLCAAEIEGWQVDHRFREQKDYAGLIEHYRAVVARRPDDLYALYYLGDAYVLNGEPEKAIELLSGPHRQHPYCHDFQHVLLDALFALGRDETDFDWAEEIPVYRIGQSVLDRCHAFLKPKRKPRMIDELFHLFVVSGYCLFTREDLLEAVRRDDRFVVEEEEWFPGIRARRKRDPRPGPT
jgi:tetratricopeptide (TPR) repeat protein